MAETVAAEPIRSMLALPTCAATNRPHEAPVKASPIRSRTCAHRLMAERVSHGSLRLFMWFGYRTGTGAPLTKIKPVLSAKAWGDFPACLTSIKVDRRFPASIAPGRLDHLLAGQRAIDPSTDNEPPRGHLLAADAFQCRPRVALRRKQSFFGGLYQRIVIRR